ncbi:MAG: AAA family ATPase [Candidatus Dojkabacteria bacterium]|nr:AAA family ATPase [Candidatus Dojkabacteria bacterium]MDQ7020412.1 AAA family ATPase [Candidatus Dojkabacteria bacterium]
MELSKDQDKALKEILKWFKNPSRSNYITLGGYAGTGKTTLVSLLREELRKEHKNLSVSFCSYTGKATRVLEDKLRESKSILNQDTVSTIHSLIYSTITNAKEEIIGWERKREVGSDLIIVDEASMVDSRIWNDLSSFGIPILAVGDHGQLPPISGSFNLVEKPMIKLEEIHRQAKENPIIELSIQARKEGKIDPGHYSGNVIKLRRSDEDSREMFSELLQNSNNDSLVLCGYNHTRVKLNKFIRDSLEYETSTPEFGDRVICLRNNHQKGIFNGMHGNIKKITSHNNGWYNAEIEMDGDDKRFKGLISKDQFNNPQSLNFTEERGRYMDGDLFDFGYAITVHKAQGSQANRVVLFEERFKQMTDKMWKRWLYTAVTRAESELYILGD